MKKQDVKCALSLKKVQVSKLKTDHLYGGSNRWSVERPCDTITGGLVGTCAPPGQGCF
ncbi:hypothetical protein [Ascidiimonas aurantiaca]|uniref:hypothetical protein n=1 Tax=Ascidiimonas aurantiaca TaxID=1685432 RepID=UPI0030EDA986